MLPKRSIKNRSRLTVHKFCVFLGNHSFDPFGSCPLVCIPHVLSYSLNFCSLWFLFPYVFWSPVHSGPLACIPRRFCCPFVCLSLILCVPMLFQFPYITSSLCIVFLLFPLSPCYQIGVQLLICGITNKFQGILVLFSF